MFMWHSLINEKHFNGIIIQLITNPPNSESHNCSLLISGYEAAPVLIACFYSRLTHFG